MKIHRIKDNMYNAHLLVVIGKPKECSDYFKKKYKMDIDFYAKAYFICKAGGGYFIWFPAYSGSCSDQSIMAHEVLHFVIKRLKDCGLKLSDKSEEAYTHYMAHIYKQIVTKLSKHV